MSSGREEERGLSSHAPGWILGVGLATLLGLGLRLFYVKKGMWWDEYTSIYFHQLDWGSFWNYFRMEEAHPPLFFLLARLLCDILGESDLTIRLPSLILGTLTVPLAFATGRLLFNERAALLASLYAAVTPFLAAEHSVQARMYSTAAFLGLAGLYLYARCLRSSGFRPVGWGGLLLAGYVLVSLLALYTHYYAVLLLVAQALHFLLVRRRLGHDLRPFAMTLFLIFLGFLPWLFYAAVFPTSVYFGTTLTPWVPPTGWKQIEETFWTFLGYPEPWQMYGVLVLGVGLPAWRYLRRDFVNTSLALAAFVVPLFVLFTVSLLLEVGFGSPVYQIRQTVIFMPGFILTLAAGVASLRPRGLAWLFFLALLFFNLTRLPASTFNPRALVREITSLAPEDPLVVNFPLSTQVLAHYVRSFDLEMPVLFFRDFPDNREQALKRVRRYLRLHPSLWLLVRKTEDLSDPESDEAVDELLGRVKVLLDHEYQNEWRLIRIDGLREPGAPPGVVRTRFRVAYPWGYPFPALTTPLITVKRGDEAVVGSTPMERGDEWTHEVDLPAGEGYSFEVDLNPWGLRSLGTNLSSEQRFSLFSGELPPTPQLEIGPHYHPLLVAGMVLSEPVMLVALGLILLVEVVPFGLSVVRRRKAGRPGG